MPNVLTREGLRFCQTITTVAFNNPKTRVGIIEMVKALGCDPEAAKDYFKKRAYHEDQMSQGYILCEDGTRCNLCGSFFPDGDDVCSLGGHQIGEYYPAQR